MMMMMIIIIIINLPIPVAAQTKAWVCASSLADTSGLKPAGGICQYVSFECCVLSSKVLRVELITRPEESYRVSCDREASTMRRS